MERMKMCFKCKTKKDEAQFYFYKNRPYSPCIVCKIKKVKEYHVKTARSVKKNKDEVLNG